MKKLVISIFVLLLVVMPFIACESDEAKPIQVDAMVVEPGDALNKAFPNAKVRVEGNGLSGLQQIILDNNIIVPFNTAYNSDKAFIFSVPFDNKKGSRFGMQSITFVTGSGSITKDFEILQPVPTILRTIPERAVPGKVLEIQGTWFYNIISVTLGGSPIKFKLNTPESIEIDLPANAVSGSELVITTPGGVLKKVIDFITIVTVSNFDGGGLRENWGFYGDVATFSSSVAGGPTGKYAQLTWSGSTSNGYNGSNCDNGGGAGVNFLNATSTNSKRASLKIDVSSNVVGAHFAIQLNTIEGVNYGYNFKVTSTAWQTVTIVLADFKNNYGYGATTPTGPDPSKVFEVKVGVAQGDTPNPSVISFDNIKLIYE